MAQFHTEWSAPEFEYRPKSVSWYWISIICAAAIIAFAIWEQNFLFGIFVVIAEILLIAWGNEMPATVSITLTESELSSAMQSIIRSGSLRISVWMNKMTTGLNFFDAQNKITDAREGDGPKSKNGRGQGKPANDHA